MNLFEKRFGALLCRFFLTTIFVAGVSACAPKVEQHPNEGRPLPRSLGESIPAYESVEISVDTSAATAIPDDLTGVVTLRDALAQALLKNPDLAVFSWEVRVASARILQADLSPNPEFNAEVENFGGSDARRNFDGAESTFALSQMIELGGKRDKRTRVASLERNLAGWDFEAKRLDVYVATTKAFMSTLTAQRRNDLKKEQFALATRVRDTVEERVRAGRASPLESIKATITLEASQIEAQRAVRELQAARDKLAALWGAVTARFDRVDGELEKVSPLPPLADLINRIKQNPDVARAEMEFELRRSNLALQKANDIPDVTFNAGVRRYEESNDSAFVLGVSIPIPVFGINRGGILEADRRLAQQKYRRQAGVVDVTSTLKQTYREAAALHSEIVALRETILTGAQRAFDAAELGYGQGKFDFLEVLDAQRTLFEVRERHLDTTSAYHSATLDIERLTGQALVSAPGRSK